MSKHTKIYLIENDNCITRFQTPYTQALCDLLSYNKFNKLDKLSTLVQRKTSGSDTSGKKLAQVSITRQPAQPK